MSKKIYMTRSIHQVGMEKLKEKGYDITIGDDASTPTHETIVEALGKEPYDAVVTFLTDTVDATLFDACPTAKLFANYSVGYNNVHLEDASSRGVIISNTPGCAGVAVAEHTIALMLSLTARVAEGDRFLRAGKYTGWQPNLLIGTDLSKKRIGLVGLGDIGSRVARMLSKGFDCTVVYTDVKKNDVLEAECGAQMVSMEELIATSDIISLHVPLLPSTTHLINEELMSRMKSGVIIVNTARGAVIDERALVQALKEGTVGGAGLDVYEHEPEIEQGLLSFPNVVLTPHIASARESVRIHMATIVADNIISFFETGKATTPVLH
ncbi:MAG: hypothetical protein RIQ41_203 [Candidatus Parcubacteria bacterium]|jgi:glyoxylate reductase